MVPVDHVSEEDADSRSYATCPSTEEHAECGGHENLRPEPDTIYSYGKNSPQRSNTGIYCGVYGGRRELNRYGRLPVAHSVTILLDLVFPIADRVTQGHLLTICFLFLLSKSGRPQVPAIFC